MLIGDKYNAQWSPLYDTKTIAAGATGAVITFFAQLRSIVGRAVTNMTKANELPAGERFEAFSLRLLLLNCAKADIFALYTGFGAIMKVSGKTLLEAPVDYLPGGGGITGEDNTAATMHYTNGVADPRAVVMFPDLYKIPIEAGEPFEIALEGTSFVASATMVIRAVLEGVHFRPIG